MSAAGAAADGAEPLRLGVRKPLAPPDTLNTEVFFLGGAAGGLSDVVTMLNRWYRDCALDGDADGEGDDGEAAEEDPGGASVVREFCGCCCEDMSLSPPPPAASSLFRLAILDTSATRRHETLPPSFRSLALALRRQRRRTSRPLASVPSSSLLPDFALSLTLLRFERRWMELSLLHSDDARRSSLAGLGSKQQAYYYERIVSRSVGRRHRNSSSDVAQCRVDERKKDGERGRASPRRRRREVSTYRSSRNGCHCRQTTAAGDGELLVRERLHLSLSLTYSLFLSSFILSLARLNAETAPPPDEIRYGRATS